MGAHARGAAAAATLALSPEPALPRRSRCERLSSKERLVLVELAQGHSTDEIGLVLSVSPHTVRTHVKNLMRKLGARTRAHAVAIALSEGAIDI
jgi:DNA-binding CsgD family transcriptional regulator